jgi:bacterioferritin (cytochrome b1)
MNRDLEHLTRLLRTELTAVHQQFFHMLALRQWKDDIILGRITEIDTEDFKNALQIIDLLVSRGDPITLDSHRFSPGSDTSSILQSELRMEEQFADALAGIEVSDAEAQVCVGRASAPRQAYRDWLARQTGGSGSSKASAESGQSMAAFLARLIALVEQPMLHAFLLWHLGNRVGADNAWRLSGAAMLYGTALVRRGALNNIIPTPGPIPAVRMAKHPSEAFDADMALVRQCSVLGRDAASAEEDEETARICHRIADDCNLIADMKMDEKFPAVFGRSPAFESFATTRERHLN